MCDCQTSTVDADAVAESHIAEDGSAVSDGQAEPLAAGLRVVEFYDRMNGAQLFYESRKHVGLQVLN